MVKRFTVVLEIPDEQEFRSYMQNVNNAIDEDEFKHFSTFGLVTNELEWVTQSGIRVRDVEEVEQDVSSPTVNAVIEQIEKDFRMGDTTALEELLKYIPKQILMAYLPEF